MNLIRAAWIPLSLTLLTACSTYGLPEYPLLHGVDELQAGEIIVAARIELIPPLLPKEQELLTRDAERYRGKAHVLLSDRAVNLDKPVFGRFSITCGLDEDCYARLPRNSTLYYSGSFIPMNSAQARTGGAGTMHLPGGAKFTLKPGDRAIYIGTWRYYRDEYNGITKIERLADHKRASQAFAQKFGDSLKLQAVDFVPLD